MLMLLLGAWACSLYYRLYTNKININSFYVKVSPSSQLFFTSQPALINEMRGDGGYYTCFSISNVGYLSIKGYKVNTLQLHS